MMVWKLETHSEKGIHKIVRVSLLSFRDTLKGLIPRQLSVVSCYLKGTRPLRRAQGLGFHCCSCLKDNVQLHIGVSEGHKGI